MGESKRQPLYRIRSLGLAFLFVLFPAIVIGGLESYLSLREFTPSFMELVYGAWIHLLFALAAVCAARILLWRAPPDRFVPAAIGIYYTVELTVTGVIWFVKSPAAPPLSSPFGVLVAAVAGLIAFVIGVVFTWLLIRAYFHLPWTKKASGWQGALGIAILLLFVLCNIFLIVKHYANARAGDNAPQNANTVPDASPDVFIVLVDALRFDHVSCNGYLRPTTPHSDAFFRESYVFRNAYTPSNKTVPSIVSYFSGLYPTSHGATGPFQGFPADVPTMAGQFRDYGYQTAGFVGNSLVSVERGFARGFDTFSPGGMPWWCYHGRTGLETFLRFLIVPHDAASGARINRELFRWLDAHPASRGPRFVYLHYMEPHSYYEPPPEHYDAVAPGVPPGPREPPMFHEYAAEDGLIDWESLEKGPVVPDEERRGMIALYDGEVHYADYLVGQVLDRLREEGVYDNAHIVFLADHGEEFGDHGGWFHGHSIYDELTRCPLAYRPPGGATSALGTDAQSAGAIADVRDADAGAESPDAAGNRGRLQNKSAPGRSGASNATIERPVGVIDFFLTLFELLEMDPPPLYQGNLVPELFERGSTGPARESVVSELPPQLFSLRYGPWKLIRRGDPADPVDRLFYLPDDPREQNDRALALPDTLDMLRRLLDDTLDERARLSLGAIESTADPATLERLRSLGYIK